MTSPPPSSSDFYLHEDEWGMISFEAEENRFERARVVAEAEAHGEANRAPDGAGWTDMYVAPAAQIELATRGITYAQLAAALGTEWKPYATVTSGYSSYRESIESGYAFALGDVAIYGSRDGELVKSICLTEATPAVAATLHRLGTTFRLILCDLWRDVVVELGSEAAIARYLAEE